MTKIDGIEIPLFASFSADELRQVLDRLVRLEILPGDVLIHEGEPGDSMYIITAGEIEIVKALNTPEQHLIAVYGPGDFIGEVALLDSQGLRSASARALSQVTVLRMTAAAFHELMESRPALAYQVTHVVSERLRRAADTTIRDLESKNRALDQAFRELKAAQEQIIEKERLEKELDVARQIQLSMLPDELPRIAGYSFGAHMQAARQVGGDFYDLFPLDSNHLAIVIGDVSDKGVPAGLYTVMTRSLVRAEALRQDSPAQTLQRVNRLLQDMSTSGQFVTVLYGVLDLESGCFDYARAGHELPILRRGDGVVPNIPSGKGMLLGLLPEVVIDEGKLELTPGDTLLLYSDGASDATNLSEEIFGRQRLAQTLKASPVGEAQRVCDYLLSAILDFQDSAPQFDDITMVTICAHARPG